MSFRASVLTLYPEMFPGPLGLSLAGRALDAGTWSLDLVQIRDFASDKHRTVDDTPAGGGAGMVMRADVLAKAIDHAAPRGDPRPRLLMSPRGKPLTQAKVRELAAGPGAVIVCGRFEGVDQRVIDARAARGSLGRRLHPVRRRAGRAGAARRRRAAAARRHGQRALGRP